MLFSFLPAPGLLEIIVVLTVGVVIGWPACRICSKAGFPWALGLLAVVPLLNLVLLFMLAFAEWPALREGKPRTNTDA